MRVVVVSWLAAAGTDGRVGSVLGDIEGLPGWFGFHISLVLPFVYSGYRPPNNPAEQNPHFRANQAELLVSWSVAGAALNRAILALLCILTTLAAKLKSPILILSGLRGC